MCAPRLQVGKEINIRMPLQFRNKLLLYNDRDDFGHLSGVTGKKRIKIINNVQYQNKLTYICYILGVVGKIMIINHFNHQVWGARHPWELDARTNASAGLKLFIIVHL